MLDGRAWLGSVHDVIWGGWPASPAGGGACGAAASAHLSDRDLDAAMVVLIATGVAAERERGTLSPTCPSMATGSLWRRWKRPCPKPASMI